MAIRRSSPVLRRALPVTLLLLGAGLRTATALSGHIENRSYETPCAEVDNVDIPVHCPGASAYRITATTPGYYPTSIDARAADFTDCAEFNGLIWMLGSDDGQYAEFLSGGFSSGDEYYAPDEPAAGVDEAVTNLPREINNDWMYDQYIRFTADQDGDFNREARIGAVLALDMALIYGTLEIKLLAQSTSGWVDCGNRVFDASHPYATWSIPDHTWMEGTDTNLLHLDVVRNGEDGSATTTNAWAYYDFLKLEQRGGAGDNAWDPAVLYSGSNVVVEAVWIDFWWRDPRQMQVSVVGGETISTSQYLRIKSRMPGGGWNEILVLYEDGYARIIPFPPEGLGSVPYGASVILGPTTNSPRPCIGIDEVVVDPEDLSLDITYEDQGTAHVELRAHRDGHVVDVTHLTYATETNALARFRSMYVYDGKSDIDRVASAAGVFPVLHNWTMLDGTWWYLFRQVPSYHNTYCPDFRVEIMGTNTGYLAREAESADAGSGYAVVSGRTNACGGQAAAMSTNGGELVFNITLAGDRPDTYARLRFSDADGGDGIDHLGNTLRVIVDNARTAETWSVYTGGWGEYETAPSLHVGDLAAGVHEIRIVTGDGTSGVELDGFVLASESPAAWVAKPVLTRQCETYAWATNATWSERATAVSNASMHLEHDGLSPGLGYDVALPTNYSHAYLRVRYSDDVGPNHLGVFVDGQLRARFPSEDHGWWLDFTNMYPVYLGALTAGTSRIEFTSTLETWGVDLDEFEIYAYDNRPPAIGLDALYTLPVGAATSFAVTASDPDGDEASLSNTVRPAGAAFAAGVFTWTAPAESGGTTNLLAFVADDGRGLTNSVVTNRADVVVPADWDGDGLADGWEWDHFATLTNAPAADLDGDGADNYAEYVAGTQPTNAGSLFAQDLATPAGGATNHVVVVPTEPGREYTIYFTDDAPTGGVAWTAFALEARGKWTETNVTSSTHAFVDDQGPDTTGGPPAGGRRLYRVRVRVP